MVTRSDWATNLDENHIGKENMSHILKKDTWVNDDGQVKQSDNGLPKDWKKGKLLGRKGAEVSDLQAKDWGLLAKAKAPTENKAK